ncbi:MAG: hypothetical protein ABII90_01765 [Bacteroidota bacterium]
MIRIITYIFVFILTFSNMYAQGTNRIIISDFKGLMTNADPYDIGNEYLLISNNARCYNGRIIKDFVPFVNSDYGNLGQNISGLFTFINAKLSNNFLYTAPVVNSNSVMTVWTWISGSASDIIAQSQIDSDQVAHVYQSQNTFNPIIQIRDEIRYLPGRANYPNSHKAQGLIIQYIDRDYFDSTYTPKGQFWTNATNIDKPTLVAVLDSIPGGDLPAGKYYYAFSYIYDGIQESLLSNPVGITLLDSNWVKCQFSIDTTKNNKRITAIKVYRSNKQYVNFDHIHTIDLTRSPSEIIRLDSLAYYGKHDVLATGASDALIFNVNKYVFKNIGGVLTDSVVVDSGIIGTGTGTYGHRIFPVSASTSTYKHFWNKSWQLWQSDYGAGTWTKIDSGTSGFYWGNDLMFAKFNAADSVKYHNLDPVGALMQFNGRGDSLKVIVDGADLRVFKYDTSGGLLATAKEENVPFTIMFPDRGLYYWTRSGITATCKFFDAGLVAGAAHPLEGEVSIDVNGKYAVMAQDRLWQANLYLAPASPDSERHEDWVSYSELGQYDVTPVSNVIRISDYYGGEITGITILMGNPVILKRQSIQMINARSDPANPENWEIIQAVHNIGNVAPQGYINVLGTLYVCAYDGIYGIRPNNLAPYESTPVINFRISEPINNIYLAYADSNKAKIKVGYDQTFGGIMVFNAG